MADSYLQHYGVKGMKWGVRKDVKKHLSKNPITRHAQVKTLNKIYKAQGDGDQLTSIGEHSKQARDFLTEVSSKVAYKTNAAQQLTDKRSRAYMLSSRNDSNRAKRYTVYRLASDQLSSTLQEGEKTINSALRTFGSALVKDAGYSTLNAKRAKDVDDFIGTIIQNTSSVYVESVGGKISKRGIDSNSSWAGVSYYSNTPNDEVYRNKKYLASTTGRKTTTHK